MENLKGQNLSLDDIDRAILENFATKSGLKLSQAARVIFREWAELTHNVPPTPEPEYHGEGSA